PGSLSAVSEARRRDQSPEWQDAAPARFRYSDLNGAARVCGGRGQIMGFEWASADPALDRATRGMALCGRERVCYPSTRDPLEMVGGDRVRRDGLTACDQAHESAGVVGGRGVMEST